MIFLGDFKQLTDMGFKNAALVRFPILTGH